MYKQLMLLCIAFSSLLAGPMAAACSPVPGATPKPIAERMDSASYVLQGVVTSVTADTATVDVQNYLKGEGGDTVQVSGFNTHSCADFLEAGDEAIFFAEATAEGDLIAVYDGAFGSVRPASEEALQHIETNRLQNTMLNGENCAALFDGERLYVPCVKIVGSEEIYNIQLDMLNLAQLETTMQFSLAEFHKHEFDLQSYDAAVESVTVNIAESFPVQAYAVVKGYLRDGCETLAKAPMSPVALKDGVFNINISVRSPDKEASAGCITMITPFEQSVPLEVSGLAAGEYTVIVNNAIEASFELTTDNRLISDDDNSSELPPALPEPELKTYDAEIESVEVMFLDTAPTQVYALVKGYLRDGCETLAATPVAPVGLSEDGIFYIEMMVLAPDKASTGCLAVVTPFEKRIPLDTTGLKAGQYNVIVNNAIEAIFTWPAGDSVGEPAEQPMPLPTMPDIEMVTADAAVEAAEVLVAESFPVQVFVVIQGYLRDGCETLSGEPTAPVAVGPNGVFDVPISVVTPADKSAILCLAVVKPFEKRIALDVEGLKAGTYTININGALKLSFELAVDNG